MVNKEIESVEIIIEPSTISEVDIIDEQSPSATVTQHEVEEKEAQLKEGEEVGWGKKIFDFLKILIFGFAVFCYDIISKY